MNEREELQALRRLAELEEKAARGKPSTPKQTAMPRRYDPTDDMSSGDLKFAGMGKAFTDAGYGIGQIARSGLEAVGQSERADRLGLPTKADYDQKRELDRDLSNTPSGMVGQFSGDLISALAPGGATALIGKAAKIPGMVKAGSALLAPGTLGEGLSLGAILGALKPQGQSDSALETGLESMGGAAAGYALPTALSKTLAPQLRKNLRLLVDEGVTPTVGQIAGGGLQRMEDGLMSSRVIGDMIINARRRGMEGFNRAAYNRVLSNLGQAYPEGNPLGREGIAAVGDTVSDAYDDLLPNLRGNFDTELATSFDDAAKNYALKDSYAKQLDDIQTRKVLDRFDPSGNMDGRTVKNAESDLNYYQRNYYGSQNPDDKLMYDALGDMRTGFKDMITRNNPQYASELQDLNKAWANLMVLEKAGSSLGAREGMFTPAQLLNASKSQSGKRQFARGNAMMQDLADAGIDILGQKVPDSGSGYRLKTTLQSLYDLGRSATIGLPYTNSGSSLIRMLLADQRPQSVRAIAKAVDKLTPGLTLLGASQANR